MKTLLISSPTIKFPTYNQGGKIKLTESASPPLGLLYLAAMLEKENFEVKVVDVYDFTFKEIEKVIVKEKPDIVGIPCFTETRIVALKLAGLVKKINKKTIVVFGGAHATFFPEQILSNYSQVDFLVLGEGEFVFLELVKLLSSNKPVVNVHGIAFRENGRIKIVPPQKMIDNLNSLPFPSHHFLDFDRYPPAGLDIVDWKKCGKKHASIITSRGCPYRCSFCSTSAFWGFHYRWRSPKNVVNEIEMLYKKFGISYISFADDTFTAKMDRAIEICKEIMKRNIKIEWSAATRVNFVNKDVLEWMKKSGCWSIFFGVESGSQKILKNIRKHATIEQIINAFNLCKEIGIQAGMGLMIGNPGEDENTINETIKVVKKIVPDTLATEILTIFPNTEIYELAKSKRFIDDSYWLTDKAAPFFTVENSLNKILNFRLKIRLIYYFGEKNYFQCLISIFNRYKITNYLLELTVKIKKMFKIKSFGIYKLLRFTKAKKIIPKSIQ